MRRRKWSSRRLVTLTGAGGASGGDTIDRGGTGGTNGDERWNGDSGRTGAGSTSNGAGLRCHHTRSGGKCGLGASCGCRSSRRSDRRGRHFDGKRAARGARDLLIGRRRPRGGLFATTGNLNGIAGITRSITSGRPAGIPRLPGRGDAALLLISVAPLARSLGAVDDDLAAVGELVAAIADGVGGLENHGGVIEPFGLLALTGLEEENHQVSPS